MPVAVDVENRHAWSELAQAARQQRLLREIVERLFVMRVSQPGGGVLEERYVLGRDRRRARRRFGRAGFINFVDEVRLQVRNHRALAAAPDDFELQLLSRRGRAGREYAHRVAVGKILPAGDYFL